MSEQKQYSGKLKLISNSDSNLNDLCRMVLIEDGAENIINDCISLIQEEYQTKYIIHNDKLYKIIECIEQDSEDSYINMTQNKDVFSFNTRFYNGGTCLVEMLEEGIEKLKEREKELNDALHSFRTHR